jgi:hypothetical protein
VIIERDIDCGLLYRRTRRELMDLVRSLSDEQRGRPVPATPAWSIHDVVSHLVGITADLNAQNFAPATLTPGPARRSVRGRRGRSRNSAPSGRARGAVLANTDPAGAAVLSGAISGGGPLARRLPVLAWESESF